MADEGWDAQMAPYQQALDAITEEVGEIVSRYREQLAQMDAALQAELAPLQERVQRLRHAVEVERQRFRPALLPSPEADIELVDEEAWLFDGQRDYLSQLAIYQARKHGQDADELTA